METTKQKYLFEIAVTRWRDVGVVAESKRKAREIVEGFASDEYPDGNFDVRIVAQDENVRFYNVGEWLTESGKVETERFKR